jgi:hypothetical protein
VVSHGYGLEGSYQTNTLAVERECSLLGHLICVHLLSQDSMFTAPFIHPLLSLMSNSLPHRDNRLQCPRCLLTGNDSTDLCVVLHLQGDEQTSSKLTAWYPNSEESHKATPGNPDTPAIRYVTLYSYTQFQDPKDTIPQDSSTFLKSSLSLSHSAPYP